MCSIQGVALGVAIAAVMFGFWRLRRRSLYQKLLKCAERLQGLIAVDKQMGVHLELPSMESPIENVKTEIERVSKSKWLWYSKDVGESLKPVLNVMDALAAAGDSVRGDVSYNLALLLAQREIQKFKGLVTDEAIWVALAFALAGLVIGLVALWT